MQRLISYMVISQWLPHHRSTLTRSSKTQIPFSGSFLYLPPIQFGNTVVQPGVVIVALPLTWRKLDTSIPCANFKKAYLLGYTLSRCSWGVWGFQKPHKNPQSVWGGVFHWHPWPLCYCSCWEAEGEKCMVQASWQSIYNCNCLTCCSPAAVYCRDQHCSYNGMTVQPDPKLVLSFTEWQKVRVLPTIEEACHKTSLSVGEGHLVPPGQVSPLVRTSQPQHCLCILESWKAT